MISKRVANSDYKAAEAGMAGPLETYGNDVVGATLRHFGRSRMMLFSRRLSGNPLVTFFQFCDGRGMSEKRVPKWFQFCGGERHPFSTNCPNGQNGPRELQGFQKANQNVAQGCQMEPQGHPTFVR
jgi:hypothetical protein